MIDSITYAGGYPDSDDEDEDEEEEKKVARQQLRGGAQAKTASDGEGSVPATDRTTQGDADDSGALAIFAMAC